MGARRPSFTFWRARLRIRLGSAAAIASCPSRNAGFGDEGLPKGLNVYAVDFPTTLTIASRDRNERAIALPVENLRRPRVLQTATVNARDRTVGYIALRRFDAIGEREFIEAITSFRAEGVRALVVDLRYNPGGTLRSA